MTLLANLPRAREIMATEAIDGLVAAVPINVYYLSSYWGLLMSAERFDAEVTVSRDGITVPATSIMGLMLLAAAPGCDIHLRATGPDAEPAMDALSELVAGKFDEGC